MLPGVSPASATGDWSCAKCGARVDHRKVVTIQNCGSQLVHMRDNTVEAVLGVLDKLEAWFHPNNYILMEIKMAIVKDWGEKVFSV